MVTVLLSMLLGVYTETSLTLYLTSFLTKEIVNVPPLFFHKRLRVYFNYPFTTISQ